MEMLQAFRHHKITQCAIWKMDIHFDIC